MKNLETKPAEQLFYQFCKGYKDRDLSFLLNLFTKDVNLWGTGIDEYRVGLNQVAEQLQRDWSQSEKSEIEIVILVPTPVESNWTAAICNAKITINGEEHKFEHLRGTVIVRKEDNAWKISHMHASFPDIRNAENGSFPIK